MLEQAYQDNRSYRVDGGTDCLIATYTTDYFALACAATSDTLYELTATSQANEGLGAAGDYVYTIDQDGVKGTTKYKDTSVTVADWKYK